MLRSIEADRSHAGGFVERSTQSGSRTIVDLVETVEVDRNVGEGEQRSSQRTCRRAQKCAKLMASMSLYFLPLCRLSERLGGPLTGCLKVLSESGAAGASSDQSESRS